MKHVAVIGAGLGGLSTALRLARHGYRVTILEKNERVGGKLGSLEMKGYRFDTGPTLLTMPFVLEELYRDSGTALAEHLTLLPVDPACRYRYPDGSGLDVFRDNDRTDAQIAALSPRDAGALRRFLDHGRRIYDAAAEPFLFTPFASLRGKALLSALRHLPSLLRIDALRTLDASVREYFADPRLQQLFNRFATYNGSSPYRAPATLGIIPYVELVLGGWYIAGGMFQLVRSLERLAAEAGVAIRTGCPVRSALLRQGAAAGVVLESGEELPADAVVCNADALYASRELLEAEPADATSGRNRRLPDSSCCSASGRPSRDWPTTTSSSPRTTGRSSAACSTTACLPTTRPCTSRCRRTAIPQWHRKGAATCSCSSIPLRPPANTTGRPGHRNTGRWCCGNSGEWGWRSRPGTSRPNR